MQLNYPAFCYAGFILTSSAMITRLTINNFKKLENVSFELGNAVVLIGPNNSGKSTILQALTLWDIGMKKWAEKLRLSKQSKKKRSGVAINRKDLIFLTVPDSKLIWNNLRVREVNRTDDKHKTENIKIIISAEGVYKERNWVSSLEFDFSNSESIYCRPFNYYTSHEPDIMISEIAFNERVAYLQPMSGLAAQEDKLTAGSIDVRIGLGKTSDVLRNIIYQMIYPEREKDERISNSWNELCKIIKEKFLLELIEPVYIKETGTIEMKYKENGAVFDLSSGGRGFHQTLLLLAYLFSYPNTIILLDEPDAHLEVIRQRDIYHLLVELSRKQNSQLIIASHSEVVLQESGDADTVVAIFGNKTKNLNNRNEISHFRKSLTDIGWDEYHRALQNKHILYLEGSTDLLMLKEFAKLLDHPLEKELNRINIHYLNNNLPNKAKEHFYALREIITDLRGAALFDSLEKKDMPDQRLNILTWERKEFENYFGFPFILRRYADSKSESLFEQNRIGIMEKCIKRNTLPRALENLDDSWWKTTKISDDYLVKIFEDYFDALDLPNIFRKSSYSELIRFLKPEEVDPEIKFKIDEIYKTLFD